MRFRRFTQAAVAVLTAVVVVGLPDTAQAAEWSFSDNMEIHYGVRPEARFTFENPINVGQAAKFKHSPATHDAPSTAHSTSHYAELLVGRIYGSWTSVGRSVRITPFSGGSGLSCQFSAYVRAGWQRFNIEVIDPDTWTYITVKTHQSPGWTWSRMSTDSFTPRVGTVFVRVALIDPSYVAAGDIDDFSLVCS